jgi:DNA polymerase (family 10)
MNNVDVADALSEIAELLELKDESSFRIRAYENASKAVSNLTEDVKVLIQRNELESVKGIGKTIAERIEDLASQGHTAYLDDLRDEFPPGVRELMRIPGVGPSTARRAHHELGVQNVEQLRAAAESGALAELPRFGQKSAENVIRALERIRKRESRISIGKAMPVVEDLIAELRECDSLHNLTTAGSLRRWAPTIGDIDLMATSSDPASAMEAFVSVPQVRQVLGRGLTKSSIITDNGLQVDLRIVEAEAFGSLVQHFTGGKDHNIELREYALARGLSLNEYGITSTETREIQEFSDETAFYKALGLTYIPPELREAGGEIEAAARGRLPSLVTVEDIRGELHMHSDWSDGSASIEQMIEAAVARGYEYVAFTDHSATMGFGSGLSEDQLLEQEVLLHKARKAHPEIKILTGTELEIKRDGSLDYPDEVLERLDFVIASVHSGFNQTEEEMTGRVVRAIENPHVDAIGHPTGRLIGRRDPYALDLEAVFRASATHHTALEINASPDRLDLVDRQARRAVELGVMLTINTDAHAPVNFTNMRYGVAMARRGWAEPSNVLNTFRYEELKAWLSRDAP